MTRDMTEFAKRVGIWCGAIIGMSAVLAIVWSVAVAQLVVPSINRAVESERALREAGDQRLALQLRRLSRDRIEMMMVVESDGADRKRLIGEIKREWAQEEGSAE